MNGLIQAATDWLNSTDGERRLKDVHEEFVTKDFCRNLTPEQTKQLFAVAMNNYVGIKNPALEAKLDALEYGDVK